jgi:hypothetical protein
VQGEKMYPLLVQLNKMKEIKSCFPFGQEHHVVFHNEEDKQVVEKKLSDLGFRGISFRNIEAGIEDSFMALMNRR